MENCLQLLELLVDSGGWGEEQKNLHLNKSKTGVIRGFLQFKEVYFIFPSRMSQCSTSIMEFCTTFWNNCCSLVHWVVGLLAVPLSLLFWLLSKLQIFFPCFFRCFRDTSLHKLILTWKAAVKTVFCGTRDLRRSCPVLALCPGPLAQTDSKDSPPLTYK